MPRGNTLKLWRDSGYLAEPTTDRELMATIGAIGTHSTGQRFAWRGMKSADYPVCSSLHRALGLDSDEVAARRAEDLLIAQAHEWGLGVTRLGIVDDLQLLADLQHYGVPTRLIDVTSDPMTALWFACQRPSEAGVLKAGLVVALNITGFQRKLALTAHDGTYATAAATHASTRRIALEAKDPFIVRAAEANPRLAAQAGYFVTGSIPSDPSPVFPSIQIPYKSRSKPVELLTARGQGQPEKFPFVAIVVPSRLKKRLLSHLDGTYNKSARTLFPDFSGFREFAAPGSSNDPSKAV